MDKTDETGRWVWLDNAFTFCRVLVPKVLRYPRSAGMTQVGSSTKTPATIFESIPCTPVMEGQNGFESPEVSGAAYARSCGAVWSARRPVKPEVAGSNPVRTARPGHRG